MRGVQGEILAKATMAGYYSIVTVLGSLHTTSLFRIINNLTQVMILGMLWLEQTNPIINWVTRQITPRSDHTIAYMDTGEVL